MRYDDHERNGLLQGGTNAESNARSSRGKVVLRFKLCAERKHFTTNQRPRSSTISGRSPGLSPDSAAYGERRVLPSN